MAFPAAQVTKFRYGIVLAAALAYLIVIFIMGLAILYIRLLRTETFASA